MILRKPYAVFIKYFKLLHAIMAAFIAFILYGSFRIYNFFRLYSIDYRTVMGDFSVENYLSGFNYLCAVVVLVLTIVMLSVMIYKQKPKSLYIYNFILYVLVIVLYLFVDSSFRNVNSVLLDIRTSKALRDFSLIALIFEVLSLILVVVRAIGFDIKRFDFGTDLQQLDISEKDSEEIEVAIEFDKDEIRRNLKGRIRNLKYVYFENKFIINMAFIIISLAISVFVYLNISAYSENYNEGKTFSASGATLNVKDSFILDSTVKGDKLVATEGDMAGAIVLVRFQVKGYRTNQTFNTGIATLNVEGLSYNQTVNHAVELYDLGTAYVNQKLTNEFKTYTLAYEIPSSFVSKKIVLKFNDSNSFVKGKIGAKNILIRLKPTDLRKTGQTFEKKLNETISFEDSILGSSSLVINSFEINNKFKLNYKYCYGTDKCIDSYEYVTPKATGNYFKTLLKLSGKAVIDQNNNIADIRDLRGLLNNYGYINYLIGEKWQSKKIDSEVIKPKIAETNDYFIEVPYEVKDASSISLTLKIRNQSYKYALK